MKLNEALQRIEALEKRVRDLEEKEKTSIHYHFNQTIPSVQPAPMPMWNPYIVYGSGKTA